MLARRAWNASKFEQDEISRNSPWPGSHTSRSYVLADEKLTSAVQRVNTRYCKPSFCSTVSALCLSFSSSSYDFCGCENFTSSTFWNWCCRMMPRTSFPYEPASLRKQGVYAVSEMGRRAPSRVSSRYRLVTGTSAVGMSHRSFSPCGTRNRSAANFGRLPVPYRDSEFTRKGGSTSV